MASVILLLLSLIHTVVYRKKSDAKRWLIFTTIVISFATGLFGMIPDDIPIVLMLYCAISIALVFFLAIHISLYSRKSCGNAYQKATTNILFGGSLYAYKTMF